MKILILLFVAMLVSCTRTSKPEVSSLKFDFSKMNQKGSSLIPTSALPNEVEVCYGVNVTASDIPEKILKCAPKLGSFAGFVSEAEELAVEVPFGKDREVQLYAFLPKKGSSCARVSSVDGESDSALNPSAIYLVGKISNVVFDQPETKLSVPVSFPGIGHSIYSDLKMDTSCLQSTQDPPVIDPNAPVLLKSSLSNSEITSVGVDENLSLHVLVKSPTTPNQLAFKLDGPTGNVANENAAHMFYACTLANIATVGHICENASVDNYYALKSVTASQWAPNGTYSISLVVRNSALLFSSVYSGPTYRIYNHSTHSPPTIVSVQLSADSTLSTGTGGNTYVSVLVTSVATPDFIERTLKRPDLSNKYSGGIPATFVNCSGYLASSGHICYMTTTSHWFYEFSDSFNSFQPNGTYTYTDIRVRNAAILSSSTYGSPLNFSIAGNTAAP